MIWTSVFSRSFPVQLMISYFRKQRGAEKAVSSTSSHVLPDKNLVHALRQALGIPE